jgi:CheY-like chemotaxis protein
LKILIVEDEEVNCELIEEYLKEDGHETLTARHGKEGLELLRQHKDIDLILLDRTMPVMGGMEFMSHIKADINFMNIPVVMQTAVADNQSILEGINAGVYYYLTKPYRKNILISVINSAIKDSMCKKNIFTEMQKNSKNLELLGQACFEFRTMEEAQNLAYFIAGSFPDPEKVVLGLSEVLINAVEHGNLGISYREKSELLKQGKLAEEIRRRQKLPENQTKKVKVFFEKTDTEIKVTVRDDGAGFNWLEFDEMRPEKAADPNGRGIIIARIMSFDTMEYIGIGNEVCCSVKI